MYIYLFIFLGLLLLTGIIIVVVKLTKSRQKQKACTPSCNGKKCTEDDGCGNKCVCLSGLVCKDDGSCCTPQCAGENMCGSDGCGGSCGTCMTGSVCLNGTCCTPNCDGKQCGSNGCKGLCGTGSYDQGCTGEHDICSSEGLCKCVKQCDGKACGPDGCEGTCGTCDSGYKCDNGQCVCVPNCDGKQCGSDGCGGLCGKGSGPGGCVDSNHLCEQGQCVCQTDCAGKVCGKDSCGGNCGTCKSNEECSPDQTKCVCIPNCPTNQCNVSDGCNGTCNGNCPSGLCGKDKTCCPVLPACNTANGCDCNSGDICYNGQCCTPKKGDCGDLGCGLKANDCGTNYSCTDNKCVCKEPCGDKKCGFDSCGNLCGTCSEGKCVNNQCCVSICSSKKNCGTDTCGNECGTCLNGYSCQNNECVFTGPKVGPGSYNITYTDPTTSKTACMYMTPGLSGASQLAMQPLDEQGNCPQHSSSDFGLSYPADQHWNYDGSRLTWHSDVGNITMGSQNAPYCDQPVCMYCINKQDPETCNELHGGFDDHCENGYYNGTDFNLVKFELPFTGGKFGDNLSIQFKCPDGTDCPFSGVCPTGQKCRNGVVLVPQEHELGRPVTSSVNDNTSGWKFVPFYPQSKTVSPVSKDTSCPPNN